MTISLDEAYTPALETVDSHGDGFAVGALSDTPDDDIDVATHLERNFLAALLWAPLVDVDHVIASLTAVPATAALFWGTINHDIYRAAAQLRADGTPATVGTVGAALARNPAARRAMLDIAAPAGGVTPNWPELRHLTATLVDAWYRRGYFVMLTRMRQVCTELPPQDYAEHWATLTGHQIAAEHTRDAILAHLATPPTKDFS